MRIFARFRNRRAEGNRRNPSCKRSQHQHEEHQQEEQQQQSPPLRTESTDTKLFEVQVPPDVQPGQSFALVVCGVHVLVTCPPNAGPGQFISFKTPLALTQANSQESNIEEAKVQLPDSNNGWTRAIRVSDMKFQWIRVDERGNVDSQTRFNVHKSAYVRKLDFRPGPDVHSRDGVLSLVPAVEASCESWVKVPGDEDLVTYAEIATTRVKSFEEKKKWFQEKCKLLEIEWNEGHKRVSFRRSDLLDDSVNAVMSLSQKDMRKMWRFDSIGEFASDPGDGLAREWFQLVTEDVFNDNRGLWQSSEANRMRMQINTASKSILDKYLVYYRFFGRFIGKALFDRRLVAGRMVQYLYKHILGWPVMFRDLEMVDEDYYNNLKQLQQLHDKGEDLSMLCLDFSTTQEIMGVKEEVELVPGGKDIEVTNENFSEYMEACIKYQLLERVKPQLNELLLGFFDVIPEPLLTVFDFQELELLMCGLPTIDMEDWKANAVYSGDFKEFGADHIVCQWFWEVVEEFDQETKARLLQSLSGVSSREFNVLQGCDGSICEFTIHGVSVDMRLYPQVDTWCKRLDLPVYESKDELRDKLKLEVTKMETVFDLSCL